MVHTYNGILLSHKKEHFWVSSSEVNECRACYREWNKSVREKQILYINAYIRNLEKWYWWTYFQGKNRNGYREWTCGHSGVKREQEEWSKYIGYIYTAAKSLQSCLTLCNPIDGSPASWDSPGKNTGLGCHFLLRCMKVKSESEVTQSCPTLSDPMDCSLPDYSIMGFSRQEYWSGVPLPSPIYTLPSRKQIAGEKLLCNTRSPV